MCGQNGFLFLVGLSFLAIDLFFLNRIVQKVLYATAVVIEESSVVCSPHCCLVPNIDVCQCTPVDPLGLCKYI